MAKNSFYSGVATKEMVLQLDQVHSQCLWEISNVITLINTVNIF